MSLVTRHISAKMEIARLERLNAALLRQQQEDRRAINALSECLLSVFIVGGHDEVDRQWRKRVLEEHAETIQRAREDKGT